jgi:hypothetical protein
MGVAIVGVMGAAASTMMLSMQKSQVQINAKADISGLRNEVVEIMKYQRCGIPQLESGIAVRDWDEKTTYPLGPGIASAFFVLKKDDSYGHLVKVKDIYLGPYYNMVTDTASYYRGTVTGTMMDVKAGLYVEVESFTSGGLRPIVVPVNLKVDTSASQIIGCTMLGDQNTIRQLCESLNFSWSDTDLTCLPPCPPGFVNVNFSCAPESSLPSQMQCGGTQQCGAHARYIL